MQRITRILVGSLAAAGFALATAAHAVDITGAVQPFLTLSMPSGQKPITPRPASS